MNSSSEMLFGVLATCLCIPQTSENCGVHFWEKLKVPNLANKMDGPRLSFVFQSKEVNA